MILWVPVVDNPPACSDINAKGLHSYNNRSLPSGAFLVQGYI